MIMINQGGAANELPNRAAEDQMNCGAYCIAYYAWLTQPNLPVGDYAFVHGIYMRVRFGANPFGMNPAYSSPESMCQVLTQDFVLAPQIQVAPVPAHPATPQEVLRAQFIAILAGQLVPFANADPAAGIVVGQFAILICYAGINLHYILIQRTAAGCMVIDPNDGRIRNGQPIPAPGAPVGPNGWLYTGAGIAI